MKKIKYIALGILFSLAFSAGCDVNEPFPQPDATFSIWGVNPETNYYEEVPEPFALVGGQTYDFIVEGEGEQFVFWFGEEGDTAKNTPKGSNFADRGMNNYSKGAVARNGRARFAYDANPETITYKLVMVASSYNYADREYVEMLVEKDIEVPGDSILL